MHQSILELEEIMEDEGYGKIHGMFDSSKPLSPEKNWHWYFRFEKL